MYVFAEPGQDIYYLESKSKYEMKWKENHSYAL